jgi:hypothetical protein
LDTDSGECRSGNVAKSILAHGIAKDETGRHMSKVEGAYSRYSFEAERREALEKWARVLLAA